MLHDARLRREIESMIRQKHYSPEYAVSRTMRRYAKVFQSLDNAFMKERSQDIFDIEKRLLKHLLRDRREDVSQLSSPVVLLAHNLTPSETANLNRRYALGFVTEAGGTRKSYGHCRRGHATPGCGCNWAFLNRCIWWRFGHHRWKFRKGCSPA